MGMFIRLFIALAAALSLFTIVSPAHAQATRTWVSGVGDDVNPCSRTAPCKTFAGAISKTAANGEINCLDPGGFGAVTITKSITIDCTGTQGSILAANTNGVIINGANVLVTLRNLAINGASTTAGNGIRILQAGAVNVDKVRIMNFSGTGTAGRGITIETTGSNIRVKVTDSLIFNVGSHGIHSVPTGGNVFLVVDNCDISRGAASGIQIRERTAATINRSVISAFLSAAAVTLERTSAVATISNSILSGNANGVTNAAGVGEAPTVFLYGDTITRNTVNGLLISSGSMTSLGNNIIRGNAGNETPTTTIASQ